MLTQCQNCTVSISALNGAMIYREVLDSYFIQIPVGAPTGIYILNVSNGQEFLLREKVLLP